MDQPVRPAKADEREDVIALLDAAMLAFDREAVRNGKRDVYVAPGSRRLLGALLLDGAHIEAVAVRTSDRGQGIGSALVGTVCDTRERVTATCDAREAPFYERLGFQVTTRPDGRRCCRYGGDEDKDCTPRESAKSG